MHCQSCNERLPLSARACFACGAPVQREPAKPAAAEPSYPFRARVNQTAPLRDRPYASARRTGFLDTGQTVSVVDARWGFLQVETEGGQRGFIEPHVIVQGPRSAAPLPADAPVREALPADGDVSPSHPSPAPAAQPAGAAPPAPVPAIRAVIPADSRDAATPDSTESDERGDGAAAERRGTGRRRRTPSAPAARPQANPASAPLGGNLPFNIPFLIGEYVRFRAVFLYNPDEDQALVITNRRLIITGGTIGKLPRVLHLDEVEAVRLQDSGTGSTNGEGNLHITMTGMRGSLHIGGVYMAHRVRNEILAACTDLLRAQAHESPQRKTS